MFLLYIFNVFCVSLDEASFSLKVTWEEREPCCVSEVVNLLRKLSLVADLRFVKKFTRPDFSAKNLTD